MVGCVEEPIMKGLKKAGGNWVDGDRFFDREVELEALRERVKEGIHTLLTAQRRMGKTSLIRELQRRLADESSFETVFVDLEHYESRLRMILGTESYKTALSLLTETAVGDALLTWKSIEKYRGAHRSGSGDSAGIDDVLYTLEHDGYLAADSDGYRFVSGLLEDWWKARHGAYFIPIDKRKSKQRAE